MAGLRIAPGLELPVDAVTQAIAILARKGAGKTYTASVLVEEVIRAKVPVVVLDPTGAWWGLRTSADGEKPGLPVTIFGGDHGDVALDPNAGGIFADVVLEHPGAYVVDLSAIESRRQELTFSAGFLERLYRAKKPASGPLLLVVDEADVFAPQRPGPEQTRTLGALEAIVRRARIKGLGGALITQRAAVLNKNVLEQTEILIAMQTTGPNDRAAIDGWIAGNGTREERDEVLGSLASLERGEAWVWSPSFLRILQRVRIRRRTTYDSSRTPAAGEARIVPKAFAQVDLDKLGARIQAAREQEKANDPAELRRQIRELQRAASSQPPVQVEKTVEKIVEVPVLNGQVEHLQAVAGVLGQVGHEIARIGDEITAAIARVEAAPRPAPVIPAVRYGAGREPDRERTAAPPPQAGTPAPRPPAEALPRPAADFGDIRLDAGARRMLSALAWFHPTPLTRLQVGTLVELPAKGSTYRSYLSKIRTYGLIDEPDGQVALSAAGVELMRAELGSGAPTTAELVEMWGRRLDRGARLMLQALVDVHPDGLSREALAETVEIPAAGSTFRSYLSKLRTNQLLEEGDGVLRASSALFIGGGR